MSDLQSLLVLLKEDKDPTMLPGRDLDEALAVACGHEISWSQARYTGDSYPVITWHAPHPYVGMKEPCPLFIQSLDAMVGLIEAHLPGQLFQMMHAALDSWGHNSAYRGVKAMPHELPRFLCQGFVERMIAIQDDEKAATGTPA